MIFLIATCNSLDSFKSGATEKNLENLGSISISNMNIVPALNVLKFFLDILRSTVI